MGARRRDRPRAPRPDRPLWSRFSAVAAENPHAWIRRAYTPQQIAEPDARQQARVDALHQAAHGEHPGEHGRGLIVASAGRPAGRGVDRDRWVFVHAGAQATTSGMSASASGSPPRPRSGFVGRGVVGHAGLAIDDIAHVDLYSCFPAPSDRCARARPRVRRSSRSLTVTGGLTFAGGPGNNYAAHAIATLVHRLREDPDASAWPRPSAGTSPSTPPASTPARPPRPFIASDEQARSMRRRRGRAAAGVAGTADRGVRVGRLLTRRGAHGRARSPRCCRTGAGRSPRPPIRRSRGDERRPVAGREVHLDGEGGVQLEVGRPTATPGARRVIGA